MSKFYKGAIKDAVSNGDEEYLNLVIELLLMAEKAKNELRRKGYGWTGLDLLKTVDLVPDSDDK